MRNLVRAVTTAAVSVALGCAGCVASSASVDATAGHHQAIHRVKVSRLHLLLAHDAPRALPGTGKHPMSIVTLYAQPADPAWTTIDDSAPTVAGAIVNICQGNDGPGCNNTDWPGKNTAWDPTVSALQAAGITPLIYLTTDNGEDSISTLETELSQAKQWWDITTPMFDQMTGTEGSPGSSPDVCSDGGANISCQSYYHQLYNYAMANGAQAVMFNPGTFFGLTPAFMYGPYEILQGFEGSQATLQKNASPAPSWAGGYGQLQFSATVSGATQAELTADVADATADQRAGLIYDDDETGTPDYATLPSWFATLLNDLSAATLSGPSALYEVQASRKSGYCLDNTGGSAANGNPIQVWKCLHNANQRWEYVPSLNGTPGDHQIQNSNGKCLDDPGDSTVNGTKLQLWACLGNPNQEWTAHTVNGSYVEYVNANGLCLDNLGNAKKDGNRVDVWACNGSAAQQWFGPSPAS